MAERTLALYNKKRDFKKTAEPAGKVGRSKTGFSFLVQKHAATRLHYDFRLELNGVLKSWAVTKGPSIDPHDKRLAVEVEDHPVSYAGFEGIIPKGEYGGGTVMMWDEGTWEPLGDPVKDLKSGNLKFRLHGKRLKGEWVLVRMKPRPQDRGRSNWLLIKHDDAHAKHGAGDAYLEKHASSVTSKRRMEEIAADADRSWNSKPNAHSTAGSSPPIGKKRAAKDSEPRKTAAKRAETKARSGKKLPPFIAPQLATLSDAMPQGNDWVHEVKFDGYRTLSYVNGGKVTMYTRNGLDWTEKFGPLPNELAKLPCSNAILDGELVALATNKVTSFSALKKSLSSDGANLSYYLFDLLFLDGVDYRSKPLLERKEALQQLLQQKPSDRVFYSEHFGQENDLLEKSCALGLEGVISKLANAPYHSGRGKTWLKSKCHKRQEFAIGGFTNSSTGKSVIGSLLLGYYDGDDFVYAGRVGTGFDQETARSLMKALKTIERKTMPYTKYSDAGRRGPGWKRGVRWVEPKLVCEVEFTEWTEEGSLRHPSFQGLREDKPARQITRDKPLAVAVAKKQARQELRAEKSPPSQATKRKVASATPALTKKKSTAAVPKYHLSSPDKILWPESGYTKQDLAHYYEAVADWMLPHIADRPLSLVRCPAGAKKPCFFQRHAGEGISEHIQPLHFYANEEPYLAIRDKAGLMALVQMGALEIHNWGSHVKSWAKPDMIVFDLDPDVGLSFADVKHAALDVRSKLQQIKLESFVKTTGGKGLHVVVPFKPNHDWETIKAFARSFAEVMAEQSPKRYTTNIRKAARKGRIFIDYLRNGETATAIAPYSTRARDGATVATPIRWEELPSLKSGNGWTIKTLPTRLKKLKDDPWHGFLTCKQTLPL